YRVNLQNLNRGPTKTITLSSGTELPISELIFDADYLISLPTVKTHAEAGLSIACKNWVGLVHGQHKRLMHRDLAGNIVGLIARLPPQLIVVDGVIAMEGNGPGDGAPVPMGLLAASDNPFVCDLAMCQLLGFSWDNVPYLARALKEGAIGQPLIDEITTQIRTRKTIQAAPPPSLLARLSDRPSLFWLKKAVRPLTGRVAVAKLAYRAGIIQDVYNPVDDSLRLNRRQSELCRSCRRCEAFCPMGLGLEQIGAQPKSPYCIDCLYCYWVCPKNALTVDGQAGALERQLRRYKSTIEGLKG
ncbi:MAG: DUF362 domain-containing protein, partial [Proteobacteria bacterium]|nr:DUF362 domain-containing protein [Pseudomonadota bacterium]